MDTSESQMLFTLFDGVLMADAIMNRLFNELIHWIRGCSLQETDKNRIIKKLEWIKEEINIYRKVR